MSVRVVARIRPLLKLENERDVIVTTTEAQSTEPDNGKAGAKIIRNKSDSETSGILRIPNPKNNAEQYSFQFNSVYDQHASQQAVYDNEGAPIIKHIFNGFDVTIFAYGVTGTGKTHTMRGGKTLADRGVIPRLLSGIYRRARKIEKDAATASASAVPSTSVRVVMSYYEIYNDRVYDLFESTEKRTPAGLPIRDCNGKTVVVGLSERECGCLKEFEGLYDRANVNRSTSATKLNAHSSRSHAILSVKIVQTKDEETRVSTVSAIDLAGSEDNRRTENGKERMTESACINKSLFALAQCVDAIKNKHHRIPYRESKMTRILSLGQNKGFTIMILNISPVRSYHLDTLSSLNFANRTKKIEIRDVENEPMFKSQKSTSSIIGSSMHRHPLRPLTTAHNLQISNTRTKSEKPIKEFNVFLDNIARPSSTSIPHKASGKKRSLDATDTLSARPTKSARANTSNQPSSSAFNEAKFLALVERRVDQVLAERGLEKSCTKTENAGQAPHHGESELETQTRLKRLEKLVAKHEDAHAGEGLQYLLMARQHAEKGDDHGALELYRAALPFFPNMSKLPRKIASLERKIREYDSNATHERLKNCRSGLATPPKDSKSAISRQHKAESDNSDYVPEQSTATRPRPLTAKPSRFSTKTLSATAVSKGQNSLIPPSQPNSEDATSLPPHSPRTAHILRIINSRDISQIRALHGVGAKKAESIVRCLCEMDDNQREDNDRVTKAGGYSNNGIDNVLITGLQQLGNLKGVGAKTVESMRSGVECEVT